MVIAGWIAVTLEIILLLIWVYSTFVKRNGTDPAGKGLAMVFVLGLIAYIAGGIILMLLQRTWSVVFVLVMAALPLGIVVLGLRKQYGQRKKYY